MFTDGLDTGALQWVRKVHALPQLVLCQLMLQVYERFPLWIVGNSFFRS